MLPVERRVLATDLLHHGHKVRGVGLDCESLAEGDVQPTSTKTNSLQRRNRQTRRFIAPAQPRAISNSDPRAAQSLKGISTIAWGCHSAAPATPGHRPPPTTQLDRSWLRNPVGGLTPHRHTDRKRSFSPEARNCSSACEIGRELRSGRSAVTRPTIPATPRLRWQFCPKEISGQDDVFGQSLIKSATARTHHPPPLLPPRIP